MTALTGKRDRFPAPESRSFSSSRSRVIILLTLLIMVSCAFMGEETAEDRASDLRRQFVWEKGSPPVISAHRGSPAEGFPENSLAAFQRAYDLGAGIIECDVRSTADGFLVLMHDKSLDRTTDGRGLLHEKTLAELQSLHLLDTEGELTAERIPLLGDVLKWAKDKVVLTLDLKHVEASHILNVIRQNRAEDRVVLIVYNFEDMMHYHDLAPHLMMSVSAGTLESLKTLFSYGVPADRLMIFTGVSEPEAAVYDLIHEQGIYTILGTMHNLDNKAVSEGHAVYRDLYRKGADILSTDRVEAVAEAVREMKKF